MRFVVAALAGRNNTMFVGMTEYTEEFRMLCFSGLQG